MATTDDLDRWWRRANCIGIDPELFFPGLGEDTRPAREVCAGCTVRLECLDHALAVPERFGVWGGKSERERRRMRRTRVVTRRASELAGHL